MSYGGEEGSGIDVLPIHRIRYRWIEIRWGGRWWSRWLAYLLPERCYVCRRWHLIGRGRTFEHRRDWPGSQEGCRHVCSTECAEAMVVADAIEPQGHLYRPAKLVGPRG